MAMSEITSRGNAPFSQEVEAQRLAAYDLAIATLEKEWRKAPGHNQQYMVVARILRTSAAKFRNRRTGRPSGRPSGKTLAEVFAEEAGSGEEVS